MYTYFIKTTQRQKYARHAVQYINHVRHKNKCHCSNKHYLGCDLVSIAQLKNKCKSCEVHTLGLRVITIIATCVHPF